MPAPSTSKQWRFGFESAPGVAANSTASSTLASRVPTTTLPTRAGFHAIPGARSFVDSILIVHPFGADANNEEFQLKIAFWNTIYAADVTTYEESAVFIVDCICGNIDASVYFADSFLVDTIDLVSGDSTAKIINPQNDRRGEIWLDMAGAEFVEFEIDIDGTGGTVAESGNVLWRTLS